MHPPSTAAAPRRHGEHLTTAARRTQIVEAALASFAEHGYERASLRDIASRAGMTHAALLRHFTGKDELLLAALARREADEEHLAAEISSSEMPGERILGAVLRDEFANAEYQRNWMALAVAATNPSHPAHDFFMGRRDRMRTRITSSLIPADADGASISADGKATLVLAMVDGLRIQSLLDPNGDALALLDAFMHLIGAAADPTPSIRPDADQG